MTENKNRLSDIQVLRDIQHNLYPLMRAYYDAKNLADKLEKE